MSSGGFRILLAVAALAAAAGSLSAQSLIQIDRRARVSRADLLSTTPSFRLASPWPGQSATPYRDGRKAEDLAGPTLVFATAKGESIVAVRRGTIPRTVRLPSRR